MRMRLFCLLVFSILCPVIHAQVNYIAPDSVLKIIHQKTSNNEIVVINFWATWCKPCVMELPYFMKADSLLKNHNTSFIYVSFDNPTDIKKVRKFTHSKKATGIHYLLNTSDLNDFINGVDPIWQGNIPYTIVLKNGVRANHENNFENLNELLLFINN